MAYSIAERTSLCVPSRDTGLIPIPEVSGKRILPNSFGNAFLEQFEELFVLVAAFLEFDAGINVFRVFTEDNHVNFAGIANRGGYAVEPADRTQTDIQIQ